MHCSSLVALQEMGAYRLYTVVPFLVKFIDSLTNIYVSPQHAHAVCWAASAFCLCFMPQS